MLSVADRLSYPGNSLYGLVLQAKYLGTAGKALAEYLGPPVNRHCHLAAFFFDTVVLYVDSPIWHSKVRFLSPDIVKFFQDRYGLKMINKASIRVDPFLLQDLAPPRQKTPQENRPRTSQTTALLLRNAANVTDNPRLRQAWLRLAATHNSDVAR